MNYKARIGATVAAALFSLYSIGCSDIDKKTNESGLVPTPKAAKSSSSYRIEGTKYSIELDKNNLGGNTGKFGTLVAIMNPYIVGMEVALRIDPDSKKIKIIPRGESKGHVPDYARINDHFVEIDSDSDHELTFTELINCLNSLGGPAKKPEPSAKKVESPKKTESGKTRYEIVGTGYELEVDNDASQMQMRLFVDDLTVPSYGQPLVRFAGGNRIEIVQNKYYTGRLINNTLEDLDKKRPHKVITPEEL